MHNPTTTTRTRQTITVPSRPETPGATPGTVPTTSRALHVAPERERTRLSRRLAGVARQVVGSMAPLNPPVNPEFEALMDAHLHRHRW